MFPTESAWKDRYLGGIFSYSNTTRKANERVLSGEKHKEKSKQQIYAFMSELLEAEFLFNMFFWSKNIVERRRKYQAFVLQPPEAAHKSIFNKIFYFPLT